MEKITNKLFIFAYTLLVVVLATATLIEDQRGTNFVYQAIYGHWWFVVLWTIFAIAGGCLAIANRIWKDLPKLLMHLSIGTILVGALLTYLTGEKGSVHLLKNESCQLYIDDEQQTHMLPFVMQLDSFSVRYYPGTQAPMDYVSYLKVNGEKEMVSMNRNFLKDGYRFCQSSFDDNGIGSWMSVNHDPYGINTTFAGYILFIVSCIVCLVWPNSRFRRLLNSGALKKGGLLTLLLVVGCANCLHANEKKIVPVSTKEDALTLQRKQVVYQNRVVPFNTVATDFVKKLTGSANYKGLMPEQVVGGWTIAPAVWRNEKMIKVKNTEVRHALGLTDTYCCLQDFYDEKGNYRLQELWYKAQKEGDTKLEKGITEIDEKVGVIMMLVNNTLVKPLPSNATPLNETRVSAEILYNRLPITKILFMFNLTLGFLSFGLFLYKGLSKKFSDKKWMQQALNILPFALAMALLAHSFGYGLRWYISGRVPLNNGYETMQFLALCIMLTAMVLCRRYRFILVFGFMLSGFTLLVAHLGQMNPQITPLMPVLNSPWLSTHVSFIMMSYALFALVMLNSIFAIAMRRNTAQVEQLTVMNQLLLYPACILLGIGILLGAVWANESWGMYWGWDPKEVWALITLMVYGASIVFPKAKVFESPKYYHIYMVLAFLTVLMTYFGVNYLLGGMHSYANQ
ncbi:MAG: cytochrome c biogenesis protein CcsA [Paludibacteraceae bacterium]|nr:cytochrome c biogenesis protein CcsA [Paludibacteraceae bacterium]